MTTTFQDDFKTVRIFQMQMATPDAANFVWQINFLFRGEGGTQTSAKKELHRKQVFLVQKTLFSYISALFDPLWPFGPFLTLLNTQTPFLASLGEIC